jgi:hypothetical protein
MSKDEAIRAAVEALEAALPVLQDYASSNPMHFYRGAWQDPRGVHAAAKLTLAALSLLREAAQGEDRDAVLPGNHWTVFNGAGAVVADNMPLDVVQAYLTPERIARDWYAVYCLIVRTEEELAAAMSTEEPKE